MFVQIFFVCAFIPIWVLGEPLLSPVSPAEYQDKIGQGFSTNWFKSKKPLSKYNSTNIDDVHAKGFRNLRLRCDANTTQYEPPYNSESFQSFLGELETVVDKCIEVKCFT